MGSVLDFFHNVYLTIWNYLFGSKLVNMLVNLSEEEKDNFEKFKKNDVEFSKVIFALNNIPYKIYELIFKESEEICPMYYQIYLNKINREYKLDYHNIDHQQFESHVYDETIRYIFVRINIINKKHKLNIHHVNCVIIDKLKKYILIFEPTYRLRFNIDIIKNIFLDFDPLDDYKYLLPKDIGYKYDTKLQKNDFYCQTYIMMVFYIIIKNCDIDFKDLSMLFEMTINKQTVGYFLYSIHKQMIDENLVIGNCPTLWSYSDGYVKKITRLYSNIVKERKRNMTNSNALDYKIDDDDAIVIDFKE